MAKRKKRSSSSASKAHKSTAAGTVKALVFFGIFTFFFAAVFSDNGSAIAAVHRFYRLLLGGATPFVGFFMLWYAGKRLFPAVISPRATTILGAILFTLSIAGFLHSFAAGDKAVAAAAGLGGGWIGQLVFSGLYSAFGSVISRLFLTVFALISLVLILDKVLLQYLHVHENPDTEDEEEDEQEEAKVKVMGELRPGPLQRLQQRLNKPTSPSEAVPVKTMPVLKRSTNWNYPPLDLLKNIDLATLTTTLTIFWCTILTHIWSESNFFDTCRNKRFSSPILILVVSQSYHSPHPMFTSKLFQSSSCFCPAFIPIFILFLFGIHLNLYPSSISVCIPIIILLRHATVTVHR